MTSNVTFKTSVLKLCFYVKNENRYFQDHNFKFLLREITSNDYSFGKQWSHIVRSNIHFRGEASKLKPLDLSDSLDMCLYLQFLVIDMCVFIFSSASLCMN